MSFYASSGRIYVTNTAGATVFDSDEALFVVTDRISGTVSFPSFSANYQYNGGNNINNYTTKDESTTLSSSVNANADTVRGVFKVTTTNSYGITDYGWFNAGGSYVHYQNASTSFDVNEDLATKMYVITFAVSGGTLTASRQAILHGNEVNTGSHTVTIAEITLDYDLLLGLFV